MKHTFGLRDYDVEPMHEINTLGRSWLRREQSYTRKRHNGPGRILVALVLVFALVGAAFGAYWYNYQKSDTLAKNGEYTEAKEWLLTEKLLDLHDKNYIPYLDAGILFETGQYSSAETAFGALGDYRDSKDMAMESRYRKAARFVDERRYPEAIQEYTDLASNGYKDSERLLDETRLNSLIYNLNELEQYKAALKSFGEPGKLETFDSDGWDDETKYECALSLWSRERWLDSYNLLQDIGDYKDASELSDQLKELLYLKGKSMYLGRVDWADSIEYFRAVNPYERSEDFISLIDAKRWMLRITNPPMDRKLGGNKFATKDAAIDELLRIIDFENAADVLIDTFMDEYLVGNWESSDGSEYFRLEIDSESEYAYYVEYSLPWFDFGDVFRIENAEMLLYSEEEYTNTKQLYRFYPKARNEMDVYCFMDESIHTLYKE